MFRINIYDDYPNYIDEPDDLLNLQKDKATIKKLALYNLDYLRFLDEFISLEDLLIKQDENASIEVVKLPPLKNLKFLDIHSCPTVKQLDISNCLSLEEVNVIDMCELKEVLGLQELAYLRFFQQSRTPLLEHPDYIQIVSESNVNIEIDVNAIHVLEGKYPNFLERIPSDDRITFGEYIRGYKPRDKYYDTGNKYHACQMKIMDKRADEILDRILVPDMCLEEKISRIYAYVSTFIEYDYESRDDEDGVIELRNANSSELTKKNFYAHGIFSGFATHSDICEGRTAMMKYLLEKIGVPAEQVNCGGKTKTETEYLRYDFLTATHSILRFKLNDGWLYCDPTAEKEKGTSHQLFAMTKEELWAEEYLLSISEKDVVCTENFDKSAMREYVEKFHRENVKPIMRSTLKAIQESSGSKYQQPNDIGKVF